MLKLVRRSTRRVKRHQEQRRFRKNKWEYTKRQWKVVTREPEFSCQTANKFFKETYSDPERKYAYQPPTGLPKPKKPKKPFDSKAPTWKHFSRVCWKKSNKSAAGFNGISFLVYKRCPGLRRIFWELVCRIWNSKQISKAWQIGRIKLLDKGKGTAESERCVQYQY